MIFQLKFPAIDVGATEKDFTSHLSTSYPQRRSIKQGGFSIRVGSEEGHRTPVVTTEDATDAGVEYRSESGNRIFQLLRDSIALTILDGQYSTFHDEFDTFWEGAQVLMESLEIRTLTRLAIRKINLFEFRENTDTPAVESLPVVFKEGLVESLMSFPGHSVTRASLHRVEMTEGAHQLKLAYGLTPQVKESDGFRNRIGTLDIDVFRMEADLDPTVAPDEMRCINETVYNVFDYVVTDEAKRFMMEEDDAEA